MSPGKYLACGLQSGNTANLTGAQYIYYTLPAVPPVLIGIPFLRRLAGMPEPEVMVGMSSPGIIAAISLGVFLLIYAI